MWTKYTIGIPERIVIDCGMKEWTKFRRYLLSISDYTTMIDQSDHSVDYIFATVHTNNQDIATQATAFARGGYSEWEKVKALLLFKKD